MLTADNILAITATLGSSADAVSESLSQCLQRPLNLNFGTAAPLSGEAPDPVLQGPGLLVHFRVSGSTVLVALPEELPLPEWHKHPNDSERSRLDTLAMEWSLNCLPEDLPAEAFGCQSVPTLWSAARICGFSPDAVGIRAAEGDSPLGIWFLFPVTNVPAPAATAAPQAALSAAIPQPPAQKPAPPEPQAVSLPAKEFAEELPAKEPSRLARVLHLPVKVTVQLARKRIELGQLSALTPGSLVKFDKSCEELLDLYVNNRLFCRGEAVKVGEKFGLKINEIGPVEQRASAIIDQGRS